MYHGHGLLEKAIEKMNEKDRSKFKNFVIVQILLILILC